MAMFDLATGYKKQGMAAYSKLQQREFEREKSAGYSAIRHQSFVGTGYFDRIQEIISEGKPSTAALSGSIEEAQFSPDGHH